jgi:CUG-BP- and ETR3-like factor
VPLVVKWADTEKERQERRAQKAQSQATKMGRNVMQQPSVYGALPVGYMQPYNGYSYQVSISFLVSSYCGKGYLKHQACQVRNFVCV